MLKIATKNLVIMNQAGLDNCSLMTRKKKGEGANVIDVVVEMTAHSSSRCVLKMTPYTTT